jgi:hypothetical protein
VALNGWAEAGVCSCMFGVDASNRARQVPGEPKFGGSSGCTSSSSIHVRELRILASCAPFLAEDADSFLEVAGEGA